MTRRPLIGVTGPNRGGFMAWRMTRLAILRAGGRAVRITPDRQYDERLLDGLVIGGGSDVEPVHYDEFWQKEEGSTGENRNSPIDWLVVSLLTLFRAIFAFRSRSGYDPDRDTLEQRLVRFALYHNIPIMGICRGAQLMNVVLGGTLHKNIEHFYNEETSNIRSLLPRKLVQITPNSLLEKILKKTSCRVNALHDQSIKDLGQGVQVSAVEDTGVVQAIEKTDCEFFLGVQWHPEYIPQSKTQQQLFHTLTEAARQVQQKR